MSFAIAAASHGQQQSVDVAVRADPVVFALGGWSVGVDGAPAEARVRASIAAFHVVVPDVLVPLVASPPDDLRVIEDAVQLALRFDLDDGWWFGPEAYAYHLRYERLSTGFFDDAHEMYVHASVGWRWFLFASFDEVPLVQRIFLEPWATLGLPVFGTGDANVGDILVRDRGVNWHATVTVGFDVW